MQLEMEESKRERQEYIRDLTECIALRDNSARLLSSKLVSVVKEIKDNSNISDHKIEKLA